MGMSRRCHLNAPSIEYFLVKDDDGCMPGSDASADLNNKVTICRQFVPISCVDMALTMPLLRSYTYSFTGEGMSVVGWR
jgi:hypothetical protein